MSFVERRYLNNRRAFIRDPDIFLQREIENEEKRLKIDRRKHCMHCGLPYEAGLSSPRICVCRTIALRAPGYT